MKSAAARLGVKSAASRLGVKSAAASSASPSTVCTMERSGCSLCGTTWALPEVELAQCPRRDGKQFEQLFFDFLHEQFLHWPLALHRQQTGIM